MSAKNRRSQIRRRSGQGMTEYVVLVGLIAIVLIGAVHTFSNSLHRAFGAAQDQINNEVTKKINPDANTEPSIQPK
jgi:Flp pilus assembly pilin Flp